jgi:4-hydroxy-2-oxoheptanedioate aldolase
MLMLVRTLVLALLCAFTAHTALATGPKRINKAIELLAQGQPYYTTSRGGYDEGKELSRTWADYINYELEHGAFDFPRLREFMQGLVDGGPTPSGHRTPAVVVSLPVLGLDESSMRANSWVVQQALATGVHGLILCRARSPEAVRVFVEASRYPFHQAGVGKGLEEGFRGSGSQGFAAAIWGLSGEEYLRVAEPWPLDPNGELLLGLKIEDRHALEYAELTTKVPGIAFAEWGPGDMGFSFGFTKREPGPYPQVMQDARTRVLNATRNAGLYFLDAVSPDDVESKIEEGVRIGSSGREAAEKGRQFTKRPLPW